MDFPAARAAMIDNQVRINDVQDRRVIHAMGLVPREIFLPEPLQPLAYADRYLETSSGRWIWAAREFGKLAQAAQITPADRILDIAPGAGYSSAVLSHMGQGVTALEDDADAVRILRERLAAAEAGNVSVQAGALQAGWPSGAPYDVIWVNGSVEVMPEAWLSQLAEGGRLAVVVRDGAVGRARIYTRFGGRTAYIAPFEAAVPVLPGFEKAFEFRL